MTIDENRIRAIEKDLAELKTNTAVEAERHKQVINRLDKLDRHVEETRQDNKWTFRLLITTAIGMVVTVITVFLKTGISASVS